jgi:hypothetical protein
MQQIGGVAVGAQCFPASPWTKACYGDAGRVVRSLLLVVDGCVVINV